MLWPIAERDPWFWQQPAAVTRMGQLSGCIFPPRRYSFSRFPEPPRSMIDISAIWYFQGIERRFRFNRLRHRESVAARKGCAMRAGRFVCRMVLLMVWTVGIGSPAISSGRRTGRGSKAVRRWFHGSWRCVRCRRTGSHRPTSLRSRLPLEEGAVRSGAKPASGNGAPPRAKPPSAWPLTKLAWAR